jgi:hypothetical protein
MQRFNQTQLIWEGNTAANALTNRTVVAKADGQGNLPPGGRPLT